MKNLYLLFYKLTKNQNTAIQLLTWLLLCGTVIHEVSHMIIAELLGVRTGKFSFIPEIIEEGGVKAASLTMQRTGPVRQTIIGLAPTILGIGLIGLIGYYLFPITNYLLLITFLYLLFTLANTMFSSPKDLEQILFPLILLTMLISAFWLANLKISLSINLFYIFNNLFNHINLGLGMAIIINIILLGLTKFLNSVMIKT